MKSLCKIIGHKWKYADDRASTKEGRKDGGTRTVKTTYHGRVCARCSLTEVRWTSDITDTYPSGRIA